MMGKAQYSIPSESNFPSTQMPHTAFGWTPKAQQSSSFNQPSNPQDRGTNNGRIKETLHVFEAREEQRPTPYGQSSRVNSKIME